MLVIFIFITTKPVKIFLILDSSIDAHGDVLSGVFTFLTLLGSSSGLSGEKVISISVDFQFSDDTVGSIDGNVDGLS